MEQYNSIQQLQKKEDGQNRKPIYPPTVIQAVFDAKTGASLEAVLAQFNSIYVQYQGTPEATRNIIPLQMRRAGLTISYMNMDSETITERASSAVQKDNDHWGLDVNWSRVDELSLSGEIAVSAQGTWIINGEDTGIPARGSKGDTGLTPWLKTIDNKLHFSYDNTTWEPCSDYLAHWFRVENNKLQISKDNKTWEDVSDYIAAYFRFNATSSNGQAESVGKLQISRDNKTWQDISPEFTNNLRISGYVATTSALPSGKPVGTIYGVNEGANTYSLHVWDGSTWVNNGTFTSIAAGVVQETGDSETEVMSQKAVTEKFSELGSEVGNSIILDEEKKYLLKVFSTKEEARASVPTDRRKPNKEISYSLNGTIIRERYNSNDISKWETVDAYWVNDLERLNKAEEDISLGNYFNVTANVKLPSGEYYTRETAVAAVPSKYRKYGLIVQYFDGIKWNYIQFLITNYSSTNWDNMNYWGVVNEPNQHLIGSVFKGEQSLIVKDSFPIIDIYVVENPNSKRIFLRSWVKNNDRFLVQFSDEENNIISQYNNTDDSTYPTGYTTIRTKSYDNSGVVLDVVVNADMFGDKPASEYVYWKPVEIVQKENALKITEENIALQRKSTSIFNVTTSVPLPSGEYYTHDTAIQAVPTEYRKFGLVVQYYDGNKWNYEQFVSTNYVNVWSEKKNWAIWQSTNQHLIGKVFKEGSNLEVTGLGCIPVIDVFTIKNTYNKRIFLKLITNYPNDRFTIQFVDENETLLCQYTTTSNFPKGLQKIRCNELNNSGVIVDILINADLTNAYGDYSMLNLEIVQKPDEYAQLSEKVLAVESTSNTLSGKTIVCLGDSITEFKGKEGKGYVEYLSEYSGANVVRGGFGGTRYAQRTTPTITPSDSISAYASLDMVNIVKAWTSGDWSFVDAANQYLTANASDDNSEQINSLKNNPIGSVDVVTMFAGTNDLTGGSIIGEVNSENANEICGAMNLIIKMILEANPNTCIFVFTPIVRYIGNEGRTDENWSDNWKGTKGSTTTLAELSQIISDCAKRNHIPVCDMYWGLGWNRYNFSNYFNDNDNTHPYKGFSSIARKMLGFIIANRNF